MDEFIKKLIERLEELADGHAYCHGDTDYQQGIDNGTRWFKQEAISIINQLAEEYRQCIKPSCKDCEVYDKQKHYCPKWCDVIKHTTEEILVEQYNTVKQGHIAKFCEDCGKALSNEGGI